MALVADSLAFATHKTALKTYLGVSGTSEDTTLEWEFEAACKQADQYLNNPFVDDDDVDETIPNPVVLGVYEWVKYDRQERLSMVPIGGTTEKTGDNSITRIVIDKKSPAERITESLKRYWLPYRKKVWL